MGKKAIVNGRVIDGTGRQPVEPGVVLVDGTKIEFVGSREEVSIPPDAEFIDALGKTVMPGILDSHLHPVPSIEGPIADPNTNLWVGYKTINVMRTALNLGVTTVVNITGGPTAVVLSRAIEEGLVDRCARQVVAGVVDCTGGHVKGVVADGPWAVRGGVREVCAAGVDLIKTASSGGFAGENEEAWWRDYTLEELEVLVDEAHSKGKPVAVHAQSQPGISNGAKAGCDMIHHGSLMDDQGLEDIVSRGLYFVPTLWSTSKIRAEQCAGTEFEDAPWALQRMDAAYETHREGVRKGYEMGIKLAVGTDGRPGDAMYEMLEMVWCGLSPMEAIIAGTRNTAEAIGKLDELGTLETGKKADVIIVEGNPLDDIEIMTKQENILLVMKDGKVEATDEAYRMHIHPRG